MNGCELGACDDRIGVDTLPLPKSKSAIIAPDLVTDNQIPRMALAQARFYTSEVTDIGKSSDIREN